MQAHLRDTRLPDVGVRAQPAATDVILRDGSTLRLRPPSAADADGLLAFFTGLSERSRYLRFHGFLPADEAVRSAFVDPDWVERGSLVGTLASEGDRERVIALASYVRLRDPVVAEVAFAVADELQGRGIGTRLLEQLAVRAARAGIEEFIAEVLPENRPMLAVFEDAGFEVARELAEGEVEVRFPIAPTEEYLSRVDERDHVAVAASLRPFFEPRSVAVLGASRRPGTIGGELFRNILRADFAGAAYPVNRRGEAVAGVRAYTSIEEIPDEIDLAVVCLPGHQVLAAAEASLRKGVRALCVISAGFAETGSEGVERQERLLALVRSHGARLVGPNCLGIAAAAPSLNATFGPRALPPGNVAFSSQSGALGLALLEHAAQRGLGFSSFISIGNKADVSSNDLLEWWEDDPTTDVIVLYLESFGNPRRFGRIAHRVARRKPLLALKSGTTRAGARAASSHTAALAGSEAAVEALFHQAGVIRARTLEELLDAAVVFSTLPLPMGRRTAIVTNAGGLGILCADAGEAAGLELATLSPATEAALHEALPAEAGLANPVDMLGSATGASYAAALPPLLADPRVDAVIALFVPPVHAGAEEVAEAIAGAARGSEKPVLAVLVAEGATPAVLRDSGVAVFPYPESAATALALAAGRAEWLRRPAGSLPQIDDIDRKAARDIVDGALASSDGGWLGPAETRGLLEAYGIPLVLERVVEGADAAVAAARELGFPVVVKSAVPGAHKTETGGVSLDLDDEAEVRAAAERIGPALIVQPMLKGGVELLAGVVQDQVFGPLVALGAGGVLAELVGEAEFRLAPLTDVDAEELVHAGKAGRLVAGYRGMPPADAAALVGLVHRLARLGVDLPAVAELDLNPVIAGPDGCVAVDARVRVHTPEPHGRAKTW
jgi:acetyl coenzyme A synthetase (ADP forming)-like protein